MLYQIRSRSHQHLPLLTRGHDHIISNQAMTTLYQVESNFTFTDSSWTDDE